MRSAVFASLAFLLCLLVASGSCQQTLQQLFGDYFYMTLVTGHHDLTFYAQSLDSEGKLKGYRAQATYTGYVASTANVSYSYTSVNYNKSIKKYVYQQSFINSVAGTQDCKTYNSNTFSLLPWDSCTQSYQADATPFSSLEYALQSRGYTTYLNLNAALRKSVNKCKLNQLDNGRDFYFVFGDDNPLRPLFWTNNVTSVLIQQYNPYTSEAALLSAMSTTSAIFSTSPCTKVTPISVPALMASPSTYTTLYPNNIPSQINNFPWGWMRIYASAAPSVQIADMVRASRIVGSRVMFIDRTNGFSQYAATTQATPPSPPFLGLRTASSISLSGYTVVQIQLWFNGTPNAINAMSTQCDNSALGTRYPLSGTVYQGCGSGLFILPSINPTSSTWDGFNTQATIDTWINVSFQTFYYYSRSNNTDPFITPVNPFI